MISEKNNTSSLFIGYLKVIEGRVSLSALFGTLRVVHFSNILMVFKDPRFKSCERTYTIDFSLSLEIKSLDTLP